MKRTKRSMKLTEGEKLSKKLSYRRKKIRTLITQRDNYMRVVKRAGLSAVRCSAKVAFHQEIIDRLKKAL